MNKPTPGPLVVDKVQNGWIFSPDVRATGLDGETGALAGGHDRGTDLFTTKRTKAGEDHDVFFDRLPSCPSSSFVCFVVIVPSVAIDTTRP